MAAAEKNSNWPGERDPSHRDVASANERPDPALISNFKRVLLASDDAIGTQKLLRMNLKDRQPRSSGKYTYPLALLSRFPELPPPDRITNLCRLFSKTCLEHVFFEHYPIPALTRDSIAPLRFGLACLASVCDRGGVEEAETLFLAGANLWPAMVEVDNSLARSVEMLLATVLLIPCGVLAATESLRMRSTLLLSASLTVARRMLLHHPGQLEPGLRQRVSSYSPMLWSLWLWDVLHALHSNHALNFSVSEVLSSMPSSTIPFQHVYRDLLQESSGSLPLLFAVDGTPTRDQAFLLLLAILSDLITVRRSLGGAENAVNPAELEIYKCNPFVPFSDHAELDTIQRQLSLALDRWHTKFEGSIGPDIVALHLYCKLYLCCPAMPNLHQAVQSQGAAFSHLIASGAFLKTGVSDQSVNCAWALLDTVATRPKSEESLCPAWMPIVIFHAALVVWAKVNVDKGGTRGGYGSIRALLAFKVELEAMHWPCCTNMAAVLERLMAA
ncbi:Fc.00g000190.m01.CDS01 [Cosmosporella sp. VM-42]